MDNKEVSEEIPENTFLWFISHERYFRYLFALIFILISLVLFLFFQIPNSGNSFCKDSPNTCLETKPFSCENRILVERASICGCPEGFSENGEKCISKYNTNPKNVSLKYVLNGKEEEINFIVYRGMVDYLSELPRSIDSNVIENPSRADFKFRKINEESQRAFLMPLVLKIENITDNKEDQLKIAVSIAQNIDWGISNNTINFGSASLSYSRYPYEVLYDLQGICGEKSELLLFLLRELGYDTVLFYNLQENHESVGVKCPMEYSWKDSGYCLIETSGPAIISDTSISYVGGTKLGSQPQVFRISFGDELGNSLIEYKDAKTLSKIRNKIEREGKINIIEKFKLDRLKKKYGLANEYNLD